MLGAHGHASMLHDGSRTWWRALPVLVQVGRVLQGVEAGGEHGCNQHPTLAARQLDVKKGGPEG